MPLSAEAVPEAAPSIPVTETGISSSLIFTLGSGGSWELCEFFWAFGLGLISFLCQSLETVSETLWNTIGLYIALIHIREEEKVRRPLFELGSTPTSRNERQSFLQLRLTL
jgi:hypothetical protein